VNPSLESLRATAERVARNAGAVLRSSKSEVLHVDSAEQHDIKLELDRRIQEQIRKEIHQVYPKDGFLGEEGGESASPGQYEWVVDPIDGTVNLFYGIPHYAVSVACRLDGQSLAGAIYDQIGMSSFPPIEVVELLVTIKRFGFLKGLNLMRPSLL